MLKEPQDEVIFQNWRALAVTDVGEEMHLCLGMSVAQVKKMAPNAWYNYLTEGERKKIAEIKIQKWVGISDKGRWSTKYHMDLLPVEICDWKADDFTV